MGSFQALPLGYPEVGARRSCRAFLTMSRQMSAVMLTRVCVPVCMNVCMHVFVATVSPLARDRGAFSQGISGSLNAVINVSVRTHRGMRPGRGVGLGVRGGWGCWSWRMKNSDYTQLVTRVFAQRHAPACLPVFLAACPDTRLICPNPNPPNRGVGNFSQLVQPGCV